VNVGAGFEEKKRTCPTRKTKLTGDHGLRFELSAFDFARYNNQGY
jgi:hypothetical protein